jgi:hypothetical protein
MSFFLDTGPIFGYCNPNDVVHHIQCNRFFKNHPVELKNHYTIKKIVEDELRKLRADRLADDQSEVTRDVELKLRATMKFINNFDCCDHPLFDELCRELYYFLEINKIDQNPKERDAKILSHAFLWEYHHKTKLTNLTSPLIRHIYRDRPGFHAAS